MNNFSSPIRSQIGKHSLVGFSSTNAFLVHIAHSPDQHWFFYIALLIQIYCCQPEWDKSRKKAASLTGVLSKMSVHVRPLRQVGIDVISLSDSWANAHLSKISACHRCSFKENLRCNALEMWLWDISVFWGLSLFSE